uniref:F-BAR domain-containing protein n=2 Tax=Plectus sambesii TaxID=2011161 RepID=A0A914V8W3_9BILA
HRLDDIQRISRKCRDIGSFAHGEISRVLSELHTAMKTYQMCYAQCAGVEAKFRIAEHGKVKYEEANPNKIGATRKHRALERDFEKKQQKYQEFKLKALKARNEYLLCIDAANAALHKYFAEDLSDLIDCMDLGMQHWLSDLITTVVSARKALCQNEMDALAELSGFKDGLDAKVDK